MRERPGRGVAGVPTERFLPRKQRSMMTRIVIPPLLPVRATCLKRRLRRGKQRRKRLPLMTRVVTQVLRSGQPPRSPAEMKRPSKSPGQTGIMLANGRKTSIFVDKYHQRKGLCAKELVGSPNNTHHVDLLTQLMDEGQLGLNIVHIDDRIDEVKEDSSKQARKLMKVLKEV